MNLYVVRHGYTEENEKCTYYGNLDPKLNVRGKKQCSSINKFLEEKCFSKVYTSSKRRTKETANIITNCTNVVEDKRLDERNFGIFEGKNYKDLMKNYEVQYKQWQQDWINYIIPKGESHRDFSLRIYNCIEEILQNHKNDDDILLVTHAGVMRVIYTYVMNGDMELFWKFSCHNGDVAIIKYEYENLFIDSINHFKE